MERAPCRSFLVQKDEFDLQLPLKFPSSLTNSTVKFRRVASQSNETVLVEREKMKSKKSRCLVFFLPLYVHFLLLARSNFVERLVPPRRRTQQQKRIHTIFVKSFLWTSTMTTTTTMAMTTLNNRQFPLTHREPFHFASISRLSSTIFAGRQTRFERDVTFAQCCTSLSEASLGAFRFGPPRRRRGVSPRKKWRTDVDQRAGVRWRQERRSTFRFDLAARFLLAKIVSGKPKAERGLQLDFLMMMKLPRAGFASHGSVR